jgi:hypothetical protein
MRKRSYYLDLETGTDCQARGYTHGAHPPAPPHRRIHTYVPAVYSRAAVSNLTSLCNENILVEERSNNSYFRDAPQCVVLCFGVKKSF